MQDALGQIFEIDLVDDADAGRDDAKTVERLHAPFEELVARQVARELDLHVALQGVAAARVIDLHGVIDDQIDRHERFDHFRVLAERGDRGAHGRQIDQERHAGEVLQDDARDHERHFPAALRGRLPVGERAHVVLGDALPVVIAQHGFEHDPNADRQPRNRPHARGLQLR